MFVTLEEAKKMIADGKLLHVAADESLLGQLPAGKWIAGTTPYFITEKGGITSKDRLFIDEIVGAVNFKTVIYDKKNILDISKDAYPNGLSFLIMPFASEVAVFYAKEAPNSETLFMSPVIGWISGFDLSTDSSAKVFDGVNGKSYSDKAVVLHVCLPEDSIASLGIVNIFGIDEKDPRIEFTEDSLSVNKCLVNGKEVVFADYIAKNSIDTRLPLVADYNGVLVNASIKAIAENKVELYAPVFTGKEYRFASKINDYAASFIENLKGLKNAKPVFSCNCILNYLYGELDGKATLPFAGPVTFGEVAYQLLNQTLVYAEIVKS
jgi:hypothetical protein